MRRGHLDKQETYTDLLADPLFAHAFRWLKNNPWPAPREAPYGIARDDARAIVIDFKPGDIHDGRLETHRDHVDLQVFFGPAIENIVTADATKLRVTEDLPEKDVTFYETPSSYDMQTLVPGTFIIFETEVDAHMPQRTVNSTS